MVCYGGDAHIEFYAKHTALFTVNSRLTSSLCARKLGHF
jgi:hypothetical protein